MVEQRLNLQLRRTLNAQRKIGSVLCVDESFPLAGMTIGKEALKLFERAHRAMQVEIDPSHQVGVVRPFGGGALPRCSTGHHNTEKAPHQLSADVVMPQVIASSLLGRGVFDDMA